MADTSTYQRSVTNPLSEAIVSTDLFALVNKSVTTDSANGTDEVGTFADLDTYLGNTFSKKIATPTGTVNGSTTSFGVDYEPSVVISDGAILVASFGYTYSAPNIVLTNPPTKFIRYI